MIWIRVQKKRLLLALSVLLSALLLLGASLPAFANNRLLTLDDVDELMIRLSSKGAYLSNKVDYSINDTIDSFMTLDLKGSCKAGTQLIYDLPSYIADAGPSPLRGNTQSNKAQVGSVAIRNGKLIFSFEKDGPRYLRCDNLPIQFSSQIKAESRKPGVHKLNLPFALPKSYIDLASGVRYPAQGLYPADLTLPPYTTNDTPLANPAVWSFTPLGPNLSYEQVSLRGMLYNSKGDMVSDKDPINVNEKMKFDFSFIPKGNSSKQGIPAGSSITYDLPSGFSSPDIRRIPLMSEGRQVGTGRLINNRLYLTFSRFVSSKISCDPLILSFSDEVKKLTLQGEGTELVLPFAFPNANINKRPNSPIPDEPGYIQLDNTPVDLKIPSLSEAAQYVDNPNYYPIHVVNPEKYPHKFLQFNGDASLPNSTTSLSPSVYLPEGSPFDFKISLSSTYVRHDNQGKTSYWWNIPKDGVTFKYQLPDTADYQGPSSIDLIDPNTGAKRGTCTIQGKELVLRLDNLDPYSRDVVTKIPLRFKYDQQYNKYFDQNFIRKVNIPFAIPGATVNGVKAPELDQGDKSFSLPGVTINTTIPDNPEEYFYIPVLKKNTKKDTIDKMNTGGTDQKDEVDLSNAIPGNDLITDFKISYNGAPAEEAKPPYTEVSTLVLSGTFKSKPGVSYKGKKVVYQLPSDYVRFSSYLKKQKVIDKKTKLEIGTINIDSEKIVIEFTTDAEFSGYLETPFNFEVFDVGEPAKVGESINVPFTLPGAVIDGKQQPLKVKLPEPTIGNKPLRLPDPNIVVLHPTRVKHIHKRPDDGKPKGDYKTDDEIHWRVGASPLYPEDDQYNGFFIAYDLPWDGQQFNPDYTFSIREATGTTGLVLSPSLFEHGAHIEEHINNAAISIKRVWYHVDSTGKPITEEKLVPVMSPEGNFIPGKYTSKPVTVPKDAVETNITDPNPPKGFNENSPCGFVVRCVNLPWNSVRFNYGTKLTDLAKAQDMNDQKQLIFKNSWYYGQELYSKTNPARSMFYESTEPSYTASVVRDIASAEGKVIFGGKLKVTKVSLEDGTPLSGGHFALLRANGEPSFDEEGRLLNHLQANEQGELCLVDEASGNKLVPLSQLSLMQGNNFSIKEIAAPQGYKLPDNPVTPIASITDKAMAQFVIKNQLDELPPSTLFSDPGIGLALIALGVVGAGALLGVTLFLTRRRLRISGQHMR